MRETKNRLHYVDQTSLLVRGLFENEQPRAKNSAEKVIFAFRNKPSSMKVLDISEREIEIIISEALGISEKYWYFHDLDKRMKESEIKLDTRKIQKALKICLSELKDLERPSRARIDDLLRQSGDPRCGPNANSVTKVSEAVQSMVQAIGVIQKKKNKKQSERRVFTVCQDVWKLIEIITRKPFTSTWDFTFDLPLPQLQTVNQNVSLASKDQKVEFFQRPDPLFVQIFVQAIDEMITFSTIRNNLKELSKQRKKADYSPDNVLED